MNSMPKKQLKTIETRSEKREFVKPFTFEERDMRVDELITTVKRIETLKKEITEAKAALKENQSCFAKQSHELSEGGVVVEEHCRVEVDYEANERRVIAPHGELIERGPIKESDRQGTFLE